MYACANMYILICTHTKYNFGPLFITDICDNTSIHLFEESLFVNLNSLYEYKFNKIFLVVSAHLHYAISNHTISILIRQKIRP